MKSFVRAIAIAAVATTLGTSAFAQATRTWVSGVGDDANPCSRTAPCKTFAGAISKTAAGGEISVLDPGGFGVVTITKSITLNGTGTLAGILSAGSPSGILVNAASTDDVVIRDISINGIGTGTDGVRILNAKSVTLENVTISGLTNRGVSIQGTTALMNVYLNNVSIRDVGNYGIASVPTAAATARVSMNNVHVSTVANGDGAYIGTATTATITNSVFHGAVGAGSAGMRVDGGSAIASLDTVVISSNTAGLITNAGGTCRIANSTVSNNINSQLTTGTGTIVSHGNNRVTGAAPGTPSSTPGQI